VPETVRRGGSEAGCSALKCGKGALSAVEQVS
jgi:hypothetical protein